MSDKIFIFYLMGTGLQIVLNVLVIQYVLGRAQVKVREKEEAKVQKSSQLLKDSLKKVRNAADNVTERVRRHSSEIENTQHQLDEIVSENGTPAEIRAIIGSMAKSNLELQQRLSKAMDELKKSSTCLTQHIEEARTDPLTKLLNRRGTDECLDELIAKKTPFSLMMIDIDHFKRFNDTHGHDTGDLVLSETATAISDSIRNRDIAGRYGGEEFLVILPEANLETSLKVASQVRTALEANRITVDDKTLNVTVSLGVAQWSGREQFANSIKRADKALYAAKKAGRNRTYYHDGQQCLPQIIPEGMSVQDPRTDSVTGLPSQVAFEEELSRRISEVSRNGEELSIVAYFIDAFDKIQYQHGSKAARIVRLSMAQFFTALVRDMDMVASLRKDCFVVMLPSCSMQNATRVAERIRRTASECDFDFPDGTISLSLSIGVANLIAGEDAQSMVKRAEAAALHAQQAGGNKSCIDHGDRFESEIHSDYELVAPLALPVA